MRTYLVGLSLITLCLFSGNLRGELFDQSRAAGPSPVPILLYHSVSGDQGDPLKIEPARFEEQMTYLMNEGYHSITFNELREGWYNGRALPPKPIIITFDDGYEDNYSAAYPILLRTGMKATIFAVTGSIGAPGRLTWNQLHTMESSGLVDTQSHTVTHFNLTKLSDEEKMKELVNSRNEIQHKLGHPADVFAYPYGFYDRRSIDAVQKAGYQLAVITEPGAADVKQGRFKLHRILITGDLTLDQFKGAITEL
ncbi:polysaccharide deacetylase family protein [Paenibacillus sp. YPG26]|uniref:polysaccharide deacetylase family protein n=1 Tax=Paenibacillus sp. YPG26 TaxID=2878915 RepID=UPI00203E059A|nr:polysaccharide deacetylase family protein [Paenibacillus sp. YPG26]USB31677.1 polysaccharide deacetylase family protein [Paenibacillus sp. YPG26]